MIKKVILIPFICALIYHLVFVVYPLVYGFKISEEINVFWDNEKHYPDRVYDISRFVKTNSINKDIKPIIPIIALNKIILNFLSKPDSCYNTFMKEENFLGYVARQICLSKNKDNKKIYIGRQISTSLYGSWLSVSQSRIAILNYYFSFMYLGLGVSGFEEGALSFHNKSVDELTDLEIIDLNIRNILPEYYSRRKNRLNELIELSYSDYIEVKK